MVAGMLTEDMVQRGAALIRRLDSQGYSPDAALWLYFSDLEEWKLVLAQAKLSRRGPRAGYEIVQRALSSETPDPGQLPLNLVAITKPDAPLITLLSSAIHTDRSIGGIRFTSSVINGTVIEDAYIYRLAGSHRSDSKEH
ncbi:MAG: hypothetical protein PHU43_07235, partial [Candidatus Bipolaricaulis sp.]|nr:hypothetical protein [Candidatus Bipolaricaulis sp.]